MDACDTTLSSDFNTLLFDSSKSDLKLICPGEGEVSVHEIIISARSPVFSNMLKNDMTEKQSRTIVIDDFDISVVMEMVRFVYTGKLEEAFENVKDLLVIGNKYQISSLVEACGKKVAATISKENAVEIGIFAETHNAKFLREKCAEFIYQDLSVLGNDWEDGLKASPLLFAKILDNLKKSQLGLDVCRFTNADLLYGVNESVAAISFKINRSSKLVSIGLYGNRSTDSTPVTIEVKKCCVSILKLKTTYKSNGTSVPIKVPVDVDIEPDSDYTVLVTVRFPATSPAYDGENGRSEIQFSAENFTVKFRNADSPSQTNVYTGQIPTLGFIV